MSRYRKASCSVKHKTRSGALRCPVHREEHILARPGESALPPPVLSSVPRQGALHEDSQLPFCTGEKVKPKHHNVGQEVLCQKSMDGKAWWGTWFEGVTIKENPAMFPPAKQFGDTAGRFSSNPAPTPALLVLRDCEAVGDVEIAIGGSSSFVNGTGTEAASERVGDPARPRLTAKDKSLVENVNGFDYISVSDDAVAKHSKAKKIAVYGKGRLEGCQAEDSIQASGYATVVIEHPGQWVIVSTGFEGVVEEGFPALVTESPTMREGQSLEDHRRNILIHKARAALTRRSQDGSEGRYLHPHNESAWNFLVDIDGIVDVTQRNKGTGADECVAVQVDEDSLIIALEMHENPA